MQSLALVIHVVLAVGVITLVLMQHGKGADAGAAFGSGASATVFGARGAASFLTRMTTALAVLFFLTSLALFYLAANREQAPRSVTDLPSVVEEAPAVETAPEAPSATDLPGGVETRPTEEDGAGAAESDASTAADTGAAVEAPAAETAPADLPAPAD